MPAASSMLDGAAARSRAPGARQRMDYTPTERRGAFKAADRHTSWVRFLKRAMIVGSVVSVSAIAIVAVFNPFHHLPVSVSLAGVGVSGTKITLQAPKITGVQQGGGRYEIKAKAGIQDITKPSIIELEGVDAHVGMSDATTTHVVASHGIYDSKADIMRLNGDVKIANTSGYTLNLRSAAVNFRAGVFDSRERLRVDLNGGQVSADGMTISNNGHIINFDGNVTSTFDPPDDTSGAQSASVEAE